MQQDRQTACRPGNHNKFCFLRSQNLLQINLTDAKYHYNYFKVIRAEADVALRRIARCYIKTLLDPLVNFFLLAHCFKLAFYV